MPVAAAVVLLMALQQAVAAVRVAVAMQDLSTLTQTAAQEQQIQEVAAVGQQTRVHLLLPAVQAAPASSSFAILYLTRLHLIQILPRLSLNASLPPAQAPGPNPPALLLFRLRLSAREEGVAGEAVALDQGAQEEEAAPLLCGAFIMLLTCLLL
jgi:hypothetical protein